ncbi:MAG: diaminopimelate decarboxylase [Brevinematales bacterium]|nr:diaminopimelate decarboxylase [Brevinematales bacterium]
MGIFSVNNNELYIDGISARELIQKFGSPLYVYSEKIIKEKFYKLKKSITYKNTNILYAMKANSNFQILKMLAREGCGIDAVSIEEIEIALKAGFKPEKILFTGINLSIEDMKRAVKKGVMLNLGSLMQLKFYGEYFPNTKVSIRINPDFGSGHHDHVVTGGRSSKFGIFISKDDRKYVEEINRICKKYNITIAGIHAHIGSGIRDEEKFIKLSEIILDIAKEFNDLEFIDIGGGIGIPYRDNEEEFNIEKFGNDITERMNNFSKEYGKNIKLMLEPGRYIVAEAGILLTTVYDIKETPLYKFVGVDSGFNLLIRPLAYGSFHKIINASNVEDDKEEVVVAGYICESGDVFTRNEEGIEKRAISKIDIGNILAIMNAGAYGFAMSSNYNSRPKPAEVMVYEGKVKLIRRRETIRDLLATQK